MTQCFSKDTSIMLIPVIYLLFVIARTPGICLQWVSRTIWPCPTCVQEDTFRMIQWHEWWQLSPQAQQCCPLAESPTQLSWPCCWTNNKQHIDGVMNQAHWYCQRCPPPQAICPQWQSLPPGSHGLQSKTMNKTWSLLSFAWGEGLLIVCQWLSPPVLGPCWMTPKPWQRKGWTASMYIVQLQLQCVTATTRGQRQEGAMAGNVHA